jgi:hypothetical protein
MLCLPARSNALVAEDSRPALISVTCATPRESCFRSMQKAPVARGSSVRTAFTQTATMRGSFTVFISAAVEDTCPGWLPSPK